MRKIRATRTVEDYNDLIPLITTGPLRNQVARRLEIARRLLDGQQYDQIVTEMKCGTALVAAVAKCLKANGYL